VLVSATVDTADKSHQLPPPFPAEPVFLPVLSLCSSVSVTRPKPELDCTGIGHRVSYRRVLAGFGSAKTGWRYGVIAALAGRLDDPGTALNSFSPAAKLTSCTLARLERF